MEDVIREEGKSQGKPKSSDDSLIQDIKRLEDSVLLGKIGIKSESADSIKILVSSDVH